MPLLRRAASQQQLPQEGTSGQKAGLQPACTRRSQSCIQTYAPVAAAAPGTNLVATTMTEQRTVTGRRVADTEQGTMTGLRAAQTEQRTVTGLRAAETEQRSLRRYMKDSTSLVMRKAGPALATRAPNYALNIHDPRPHRGPRTEIRHK
jgi:hypothetical protein